MPLISIFVSTPESVAKFTIEQVVSAAGDGILKDGSVCSLELRGYIRQIGTERISAYIDHCLSSSFPRSGMVLQDLVNELGYRLDYTVANGQYQGTVGKIGYDGLWASPEGHTLVVEVKTTDAYRLSLDILAGYRDKLLAADRIPAKSSVLIIVGRQDTGELEAQIRGSKHALDIRVISAEALIKLVLLKENAESVATGEKMRSLLTPIEYTRLDRMVDVMFATATDVEESNGAVDEVEQLPTTSASEIDSIAVAQATAVAKGIWQGTDKQLLQAKRQNIVAALARREGVNLIKKSRALYWTGRNDVRVACGMSKRYDVKNQALYWYAYHPQWDSFLSEAENSFFVLGCMDTAVAFAVPRSIFSTLLPRLNTTTTSSSTYWHVHIVGNMENPEVNVPKGRNLDLRPYGLAL